MKEIRKINPEHIEALMALINRGPFFELLSMKICALDIGYSKLEVDLERKHLNPFGTVHGGLYASVIDTAAFWALYCELDEYAGSTTIDLKVDNVAGIVDGKIIIEGKSIRVGRSLCLSDAAIRDGNGKLLAVGTSKVMLLAGRQSLSQLLETLGSDPLPPKFLP